jgi:hypothetical protein
LAKTSIDVGMLTSVIVTTGTGGFEDDRRRCHHVPPVSDAHPHHDAATPTVDAEIVEDAALEGPVMAEETLDGIPVLADVRAIESSSPASLPVVQAAAAAATGFVAGAATLALVRRHSARKLARSRQPRRAIDALPIVGSRSFLVDVHLIAKPGE